MHRGKVDPGVSELPRGNELSRDHVNRPSDMRTNKECGKYFRPIQTSLSVTETIRQLKFESKKTENLGVQAKDWTTTVT